MDNRASPIGAVFGPGHYGAQVAHPGVFMAERYAEMVQAVFGRPRTSGAFDAGDRVESGHYQDHGDARWIPVGPREWLVLSTTDARDPDGAGSFLDGLPRVFDLSHARMVVRLSGEHARDVLAKGCPLDLTALMPGRGASTVLGPFSVVINCDTTGYEVVFNRTYARSGWEWLAHAALEFGLEVQAARPWANR